MDHQKLLEQLWSMALEYAPKILLAILTIIIGLWIIGRVSKLIGKYLSRRFEDTLANFLTSLISIGLKILLFFSVAAKLGFDTTSFVAILAALMVGVGMALNGTIGHFASGVMLMIFRPFKVGDLVTLGGDHTGTVESINAFNTTLETLDNKRIIIANSNVTGNTITNISGQGIIGVEVAYHIGYGEDIDKARRIILEVGQRNPNILDDPAQGVVVAELSQHAVKLASRPFCESEHYWDVLFYMKEEVKKAFEREGVKVPYQRMDLQVSNV